MLRKVYIKILTEMKISDKNVGDEQECPEGLAQTEACMHI